MKLETDGPNFDRLENLMQAGYALANANLAGACEKWRLAWDEFLALFDRGGFKSIDAFDRRFRGTQYVSNWVQDFEMELGNAAIDDPRWHAQRIAFCEEFLRRFSAADEHATENMRRALAEAEFGSERGAHGDALYEQWLADDPRWGWGWIGWADNYYLRAARAKRDLSRAEALLRQGLAVPEVRYREDILERLATLCEEGGRTGEAEHFQKESDALRRRTGDTVLSLKTKMDFGEEGLPLDQLPYLTAQLRRQHEHVARSILPVPRQKVGRNDPCPCGSGRKFKKCCGA